MKVAGEAASRQLFGTFPRNSEEYGRSLTTTSLAEKSLVLAVLREPAEAAALAAILEGADCRVQTAPGYRAAMHHLRARAIPVIITDTQLPDGDWMDVLSRIAPILNPPRVIVASAVADSRLWSEVLHLGGFDVLVKPFQHAEVTHAVGGALRAWSDTGKLSRKPLVRAAGL